MSDLAAQVTRVRGRLREAAWSPARSDMVLESIQRRRRRFTISSVALGSAVAAVAVAVLIVWLAQDRSQTRALVAAAEPTFALRDGTRAIALGGDSRLRLLEESPSRVSFAVESGKGWFEVTPSATRQVVVRAKDVRVMVQGTEFVVELDGEIVHVWVRSGQVKVSSGGVSVVLREGQEEVFPANDPAAQPALAAPHSSDAGVPDAGVPDAAIERAARPSSRDAVVPALPEPAPSETESAREEVDRLWKQADAARLHGDNKLAIVTLTRLLSDHQEDPRAPLAAFSLGRVLIDSGQSTVTAARAFAKARKLAPQGPLVEDALLREVEAWHAAGDERRVASRVKKYLRLFPKGRYRKQMEEMRSLP